MAKKRKKTKPSEEELQGPPPREATLMRGDAEAREEREETEHRAELKLTGGDLDADWQRAGDVGEEAVGGTVATPDQDDVDEIGKALGVSRSPDEEVRTSAEILEKRDRHRAELEE
jgi:hypothetical protein